MSHFIECSGSSGTSVKARGTLSFKLQTHHSLWSSLNPHGPKKNAQTQTALNLFDESCHWFWTRFKLEEVHCRDQSPNLIASCIFSIVPQRCSNLKNQSCHSPILFHANIFKESTSLTVMKPSKDLSRQWGLSVTTFHYILNSKR